jgi:hypothetical protein
VQELKDAGMDPWVDYERLKTGDVWNEAITKALVRCHGAVILCSRDSTERNFVKYEVGYLSVRKRSEPEFTLCPLLLGGLEPETIQEGFFGAIRLHDLQFYRWEHPDRQQHLIEQFDGCKRAAETPTSPVAKLELHLAEQVFSRIPQGLLRAAAEEVEWDRQSNWDVPEGHAQLFTRHLLSAPMGEQYRALKELKRPLGGRFGVIFEAVAPFWVDEQAASEFYGVLKAPPQHRAALVNGTIARFTPQMFLRRAQAHLEIRNELSPEGEEPTAVEEGPEREVIVEGGHVPEGRFGAASLRQQALRSISYQLHGPEPANEEELLRDLEKLERIRESVVSVLILDRPQGLKELAALQEEFGTVTFFALTGPEVPAVEGALKSRLKVIQPLLGSFGSEHHNEPFAYDMYTTIRAIIQKG